MGTQYVLLDRINLRNGYELKLNKQRACDKRSWHAIPNQTKPNQTKPNRIDDYEDNGIAYEGKISNLHLTIFIVDEVKVAMVNMLKPKVRKRQRQVKQQHHQQQ